MYVSSARVNGSGTRTEQPPPEMLSRCPGVTSGPRRTPMPRSNAAVSTRCSIRRGAVVRREGCRGDVLRPAAPGLVSGASMLSPSSDSEPSASGLPVCDLCAGWRERLSRSVVRLHAPLSFVSARVARSFSTAGRDAAGAAPWYSRDTMSTTPKAYVDRLYPGEEQAHALQ